MFKKIRVYDMDGTIVNSVHRYRTINVNGVDKIDLEFWRANCTPEKIMADSLLPLAEQYKRDLADPETYVIIATARVMQDADFKFVAEKLGQPNKLFYRKAGDTRRGAELKGKQLRGLFSLRQFAKITDRMFFEDNHDYLAIAPALGMVPVFVPSNQGH